VRKAGAVEEESIDEILRLHGSCSLGFGLKNLASPDGECADVKSSIFAFRMTEESRVKQQSYLQQRSVTSVRKFAMFIGFDPWEEEKRKNQRGRPKTAQKRTNEDSETSEKCLDPTTAKILIVIRKAICIYEIPYGIPAVTCF